VGAGNECCVSQCSAVSKCTTAAGACADICTGSTLTTGRNCQNCGPNNASGTCSAGSSHTCDGTTHTLCQQVSCEGSTYYCTNTDGWQWRTSNECNDGDPDTDNDVCKPGPVCEGSTCLPKLRVEIYPGFSWSAGDFYVDWHAPDG